MYKHSVQFVPKGVSPGEANSIKTVEFKMKSNNRREVKKRSYMEAQSSNSIDSYALRNHWEIFNCDIKYADKPWNGFDELCSEIISKSEASDWKLIENVLYVVVDKDKKQNYIKKIESYYDGLNPRVHKSDIIAVTVEPKYS
jgi:hypothetical protein